MVEGFWNALARCLEQQVGAWTILYTLVYFRDSQKLLIVASKAPR